ncbi:MAG: sensor histidine kinase [Coriobacteriales bacterium]|nr:sensor histidine kinase [Coriobacteriales bacterium]
MSVLEYIRAKAAGLFCMAVGIISACVIAAVCGCPPDAVVLIAAVLLIATACACAIDCFRIKRFYDDLHNLAEKLERPYQLHALMKEPTLSDQAIVYEALEAMGTVSANEVAQANAKAKEHREFVEGWVHGIKAPLASCSLIAERVNEPERSQLRLELDKVGKKVDAALWYARSDCANQDYAIHEVTLAEIPRKVCRDNARFLIEQDCIPEIAIDESLKVFTDKKQAVFIVSQLVENAAKYGAHHLRFTAEQNGSDQDSGYIVLRVEDDGRGIPAEDVSRVFERGFTGTRGREGAASTGMGLYLAARLCEQLGLGLSISSVDGEGTCASVKFPLDRRRLDAQCDNTVSYL